MGRYLVVATFVFASAFNANASAQDKPASPTPVLQQPDQTKTGSEAAPKPGAGAGQPQVGPTAPRPTVTCVVNRTPKDGTNKDEDKSKQDKQKALEPKTGKEAGDFVSQDDRPCEPKNIPTVRVGDQIQLSVNGLAKWEADQTENKGLHVFLNGVELKNVELHRGTPGAEGKPDIVWAELTFDNGAQNRKAWVQVLQAARDNDMLPVTLGPDGGPPFVTTANVKPNVFATGFAVFAGILLAGVTVVLIVLGFMSNLLRNASVPGNPHSLAKYQMAVWFLVVVAAYLFVSGVTGAVAATSPTALLLIGISGATGLAAITIDNNKQADAAATRQALEAEKKTLNDALDNSTTGLKVQLTNATAGSPTALELAAAIQAKAARRVDVEALLTNVPSGPVAKPHWYLDLLSDENGVSFHRLQIAVWTLVLVGVFVRSVWRELAMPDFDATTLGLMGLSSGTYLGFKLPEQK